MGDDWHPENYSPIKNTHPAMKLACPKCEVREHEPCKETFAHYRAMRVPHMERVQAFRSRDAESPPAAAP